MSNQTTLAAATGSQFKAEVCPQITRRQLVAHLRGRFPGITRSMAERCAENSLHSTAPIRAAEAQAAMRLGGVVSPVEQGMLRGVDPTANTAVRHVDGGDR